MEIPMLKIEPKKYTGSSAVISLRMPRDMVEELNSIVTAAGYTRSELILLCLEFSMQHMEIIQRETNERG